jgi:hypothetical protein
MVYDISGASSMLGPRLTHQGVKPLKDRIRIENLRQIAGCILLGLASITVSPTARAADEAGDAELKKLRLEYLTARDQAAKAVQPALKDPQFEQKATAWMESLDAKGRTAQRLAKGLFVAWKTTTDPAEAVRLEPELGGIYRELTGPSVSEKKQEVFEFFSALAMDGATQPDIGPKRAAFLATLTVPHQGVRECDRLVKLGKPSEPWGWEIQDAYSLALARAGQFQQAREENDLLQAKVDLLLRLNRVPALAENRKKVKRDFLVHRSLIESLAGNGDEARKLVTDVSGMAGLGKLGFVSTTLLDEVRQRLETK